MKCSTCCQACRTLRTTGAPKPGPTTSRRERFDSAGHLSKEFDPSVRQASEDYEFAWVSDLESPYSEYLEESIRSTAAASGIQIGAVCGPRGLPSCIDAVVESRPDAVIFSTWSWPWTVAESAMELFADERIPAVFPRVWHPNMVLFNPNEYAAGAIAGINSGLYAQTTWRCEDLHVLLADTTWGTGITVADLGFVDGVEAVCGNQSVSQIPASDPSGILDATSDWLTANAGAERILAYSDNHRAVSMSYAMENAGRSGVAAGYGAAPGFIRRLSEGSPEETRYLGSVAEFPELYGVYAVAALIDILEGRPIPREINVDQVWIDRNNVDQYYDSSGVPIHDLGHSTPAGSPSDTPGGPFTLTVNGNDYAMPGPAAGIPGGLPPHEVFPWTYNFETATFEAGDSPAAPFDPATRSASQDYEIAYVSGWAALKYAQHIQDSIERTAATSGVSVGTICDSQFDPDIAVACAERVAESGPDAVVFSNWRSEATDSSMEVFNNAGIPVLTMDVWHPNAIFFGANNYVSGALAGINTGLYALETWNCEGVHVLLARNPAARGAADQRTSGFADGVQAVCGDVPVSDFDVNGSPENGLQSTTAWLTANPGAEHVLATSLDDVVAVPMSQALEHAGRSGVAAGHGAEPNGIRRVYEGPASETRYLGSVAYFPELYGNYAVAALIDVLEGRAVPQEIHMDHIWIDRNNVDQYYDSAGAPVHQFDR